MYPENPEGTQVILGSMNMGYIFDTVRNWTHNLFCPKYEPIPLGHIPPEWPWKWLGTNTYWKISVKSVIHDHPFTFEAKLNPSNISTSMM